MNKIYFKRSLFCKSKKDQNEEGAIRGLLCPLNAHSL